MCGIARERNLVLLGDYLTISQTASIKYMSRSMNLRWPPVIYFLRNGLTVQIEIAKDGYEQGPQFQIST